MAFLTYEGVGITAMAAAVPRCVVDNYKYTQYLFSSQWNKLKVYANKKGISMNVVSLMPIHVLRICVLLRRRD